MVPRAAVLIDLPSVYVFVLEDQAQTGIYTLSLHDALPICPSPRVNNVPRSLRIRPSAARIHRAFRHRGEELERLSWDSDRKSTRLNSSHGYISYAVFCLKKKKQKRTLNYYKHTYAQKHNTA